MEQDTHDEALEKAFDCKVADSDCDVESAENQARVDAMESEIAALLCGSEEDANLDGIIDDVPAVDRSVANLSDFDYSPGERVLGPDEIVQYMVDCINEVKCVVEIPATAARILLNHLKWDTVRLIERFYDDDQDRLFSEARLVNPFENCGDATMDQETSSEECGICLETKPLTESECGHRFCKECWGRYFTAKIMEEGVGQTIACAATGCDIYVADVTVMRLVTDPNVKLKYQLLITNGFVACNRLLRWCPSADCPNAIRVRHVDKIQRVTCKCGRVFCFNCGQDWHDPIKCAMLKKWTKRCEEDTQTAKWVAANNAKGCPECEATIEKKGGCCHMTCVNPSCRAEFCWSCLEPWKDHNRGFSCNVYGDGGRPARRHDKCSSALRKHLFYCARFTNHKESLLLEHKLYESVERKMDEVQRREPDVVGWMEVRFLRHAVDVLVQCRQTLMHTYAFAYYLQDNCQAAIFKGNQKDLESATETLSEYLERDLVTTANYDEIRLMILNKCGYCQSRRKVLLEHVHEGYDKNWWEYNPC